MIQEQLASTGRLTDKVRPKKYTVKIHVEPETRAFKGECKIDVEVARGTDHLTLHSADLTIESARVAGRDVSTARISADKEFETITLALEEPVGPGAVTLEFQFSSPLNQHMKGLYESKAKYQGREERYAFTQFEATDARRMFPCFDEPAFKATFDLIATVPTHLTALSNMPVLEERIEGPLKTVTFATSPKMSTYLLALDVARLVSISKKVEGTEVRVWTMPQDIGQAGFAMECACEALKRLNKYFGIKYQLAKMDHVAVPDFASGAMENWGVINYRDSAILIDPKLSSTKARRRVAEVVFHEIVHQWFGNLVTMEWWNDIWLNEAFATWLSYKLVDEWKPKWNMWLAYDQRKREPQSIDALKNTRAISATATSVADIRAMFDPLTYVKGGAILRMIEAYLGDKAFRAGIHAYMRKYKYGNTVAAHLWRELEKASKQPISAVAKDWISQPGYPIVSVSASSPDMRSLTLTQRRFSAYGRSEAPQTWTIPVAIKTQQAGQAKPKVFRTMFSGRTMQVKLPGKGKITWIYPNDSETGFYRLELGGDLLNAIMPKLAKLSPVERGGLLNHVWAQARNGEGRIEPLLDLIGALKGDKDRYVLEELAGYVDRLEFGLLKEADRKTFSAWAASIFASHWKRLNWTVKPKDDDETKLARTTALWALGAYAQDGKVLEQAGKKLDGYLKSPTSLDPTLVLPVLRLCARAGDSALFDTFHQKLTQSATPEQKDNYLVAMASFQQPELATRLMDLALSEDIRGQDAWKPVIYLLRSRYAQAATWEYVKAKWQPIRNKISSQGANYVIEACSNLWTREWLSEVRDFFSRPENEVKMARRTFGLTQESIELGIRFREAQTNAFSGWLSTAKLRL